MMRSINKVILVGNLTRNPEIKTTANGQPITTFGLATNRQWVTQSGEKHSLAEFHNIAAWGKLAEICSNYLKKGKLVYIEGYLKTRSWDSEEGVRIFRTEVVAQDMIMLEKKAKEEEFDSDLLPVEDTMPDTENGEKNIEEKKEQNENTKKENTEKKEEKGEDVMENLEI